MQRGKLVFGVAGEALENRAADLLVRHSIDEHLLRIRLPVAFDVEVVADFLPLIDHIGTLDERRGVWRGLDRRSRRTFCAVSGELRRAQVDRLSVGSVCNDECVSWTESGERLA